MRERKGKAADLTSLEDGNIAPRKINLRVMQLGGEIDQQILLPDSVDRVPSGFVPLWIKAGICFDTDAVMIAFLSVNVKKS